MPQKKYDNKEEALRLVLASLANLEYGQIVITVHESRVVQIEKIERTRLDLKNLHEQGSGI